MIVDNTPSVMVEEMTSHMLALISASNVGLDKLPIYDVLDPPSDDINGIKYAASSLHSLGVIDRVGKITELGKMINTFRKISIEPCKMT
jgi:HrpA-like RNA helicase